MSTESRSPSEFRESTRAPLKVPATLQLDAFSDPLSGFTANVSQGGMFVGMESLPPVGAIVKFHLDLSSPSQAIRGTAEVVWMRTEAKGPDLPAGVGLQFRYIEDDASAVLITAVTKVLEELGPEPTPAPEKPRPPRARRPPAPNRPTDHAKKSRKRKKARESKKVLKKPKTGDEKEIFGLPAERVKLILLVVLMGILLLSFLL